MLETESLLRELAPQVLGAVVRRFRDFAASEDAVQEALLAAAVQWPRQGLPDNPRGWLIHVAARRMTDHIRTELSRRRREEVAVPLKPALASMSHSAIGGIDGDQDDTLILLFMCCHPALTRPSAIALTLRAVGGLTTTEIANAFLVPEATMAQRISRAKQQIRKSGLPFVLPSNRERAERLGAVLHALYLIFNEGYTSSSGEDLRRADLSDEAIRLTRLVNNLLPDDGEVAGLLALMLLTDARRAARSGPEGELIPLDKQDRALWDLAAISEGVALISRTLSRGSVGMYQLQAAIAAVHDEAARAEDTDWPQILALYSVLKRMSANPMIELNHAIAAAMVHGATEGLRLLEALDGDPRLATHYRLSAVRAHLLEMAGEPLSGDPTLSCGRGPDDEHPGAELPHGAGGAASHLSIARLTDPHRSRRRRTTIVRVSLLCPPSCVPSARAARRCRSPGPQPPTASAVARRGFSVRAPYGAARYRSRDRRRSEGLRSSARHVGGRQPLRYLPSRVSRSAAASGAFTLPLTISFARELLAVHFGVLVEVLTQRRTGQRDPGEGAARTGVGEYLRIHRRIGLGAAAAAHGACRDFAAATERELAVENASHAARVHHQHDHVGFGCSDLESDAALFDAHRRR